MINSKSKLLAISLLYSRNYLSRKFTIFSSILHRLYVRAIGLQLLDLDMFLPGFNIDIIMALFHFLRIILLVHMQLY